MNEPRGSRTAVHAGKAFALRSKNVRVWRMQLLCRAATDAGVMRTLLELKRWTRSRNGPDKETDQLRGSDSAPGRWSSERRFMHHGLVASGMCLSLGVPRSLYVAFLAISSGGTLTGTPSYGVLLVLILRSASLNSFKTAIASLCPLYSRVISMAMPMIWARAWT